MAAYAGKYTGNKAAISVFARFGCNVFHGLHGRTNKPFNGAVINVGALASIVGRSFVEVELIC